MRLPVLLILLAVSAHGAVSPADDDTGLAQLWQRTLAAPLVAMYEEDFRVFPFHMGSQVELAQRLRDVRDDLGGQGSGPLLSDMLEGVGPAADTIARPEEITALILLGESARTGTLAESDEAAFQVGLGHARRYLDDVETASRAYPDSALAWQLADAWWQSLLQGRPVPVVQPPPTGGSSPGAFISGDLYPGGQLVATFAPLPDPATLDLEWANVTIPAGSGRTTAPIPFNTSLGPTLVRLVGPEGVLLEARPVIDEIPVEVFAEGPRRLVPNATHAFTFRAESPVALNHTPAFNASLDGQPLVPEGGAWRLGGLPPGEYELVVTAETLAPWADAESRIPLLVVPPRTVEPPPEDESALLAVSLLTALLVAALGFAWWRGARRPLAFIGLAKPTLRHRLARWWRNPGQDSVRDFRRAARQLRAAGMPPSTPHESFPPHLARGGIAPKRGEALARAYEDRMYAGDAAAEARYWRLRR